jgi:hypothetical protein
LKWRILSVALIIVASGCASVRLLPAQVCLRKTPLCRSTWPALALGVTILAGWFVHSATPYMVPVCTRGIRAEFEILHVKKSGLRIQQTVVSAFRDGQVYVWRDERRLFQSGFERRFGRSVMGFEPLDAFAQSSELWNRHTLPAGPLLRSWDTERWYVVVKDSRLLTFAKDDRTSPPQEITAFLRAIETLPLSDEQSFKARDVCLGFRYDPLAEMGYLVPQDRARLLR